MFSSWSEPIGNNYYQLLNNSSLIFSDDKITPITKGYNTNDLIYAIAKKISQNVARAPEGIYEIVNEKAYKERKYLLSKSFEREKLTITDYKVLAEKAVNPAISHELNKVLLNPNNNQSQAEYIELRTTYKLLTGDSFEYAILNGRKLPISFEMLPAHMIQIKTDKQFPVGIAGYYLNIGAKGHDFEVEEILQTSYPNPNWSEDGRHLYGFAPLRAGLRALMTDNEAKETMAEMLHNRGARAMLFIDADSDGEAQEQTDYLREKFRQLGQDYRNEVTVGIGRPTLVNFGFTPEELKITDNNKITREQLCNLFNVPSALFNNDAQTTRDNIKSFQKDFILNAVIPELNQWRDSFNRHAQKYFKLDGRKYVADYDLSVFGELEVDKSSMWSWLKDAPYTENEKRIFLGDQPIDNIPEMDKVYINSNKIPIEMAGEVRTTQNQNQDEE